MDRIASLVSHYASRAINNLSASLDRLTLHEGIRLVEIIGAYVILRQIWMKYGARRQARDHERELDPEELQRSDKASANSPRGESLNGKVHIPQDTDSESEGDGKTMDWGKKARRRQRRVMRDLLEREEQRRELDEHDSDREIQEYLVE